MTEKCNEYKIAHCKQKTINTAEFVNYTHLLFKNRVQNIEWICTDGRGYVEDIGQAVTVLSITGPVLTICADLPGITAKHIKTVLDRYNESGCPACSVWVKPAAGNFIHSSNGQLSATKDENSIPGIPVGLNIIQGDLIAEEQNEIQIILSDPLLVLNINTREDMVAAEKMLRTSKSV